MIIGDAARASGLPAKMIRYYESHGLIPQAARSGHGYRSYTDADVDALRFISRARVLGFSVRQMRRLLSLRRNDQRASADVKALVLAHVADLNARATTLMEMSRTLQDLADACRGDGLPDCPIMDSLMAAWTSTKAQGVGHPCSNHHGTVPAALEGGRPRRDADGAAEAKRRSR